MLGDYNHSLEHARNQPRKGRRRMDWAAREVLVTGAGGFIGSHLVEALAIRGARVRAFLRYTSRPDNGLLRFADSDVLRHVEFVRGDLRDADAVRHASVGVDTIFHLGALIGIPYSYVHPREVVDTNVMGTLNVLEAARASGLRRLVHTSTSEVYGTALTARINETHRLQGQSPYSASKIGADKLVESYSRSFQLPVVTVRPFNTYGPRQSARAVIPTIISQALSGQEVRLGSLTPTRDLTFVRDTVDGFLRASECDEALGLELNLGTDREVSIGELARLIAGIVGSDITVVEDPTRIRPERSEVMRLHADASLARQVLGWSPTVQLESGLAESVAWVREHADFYRAGRYEV
jgi:NAD dependent epimerase/dehydratase